MTETRLSFEQRKTILKWYWKTEKISEVQRLWRNEFATDPPSRLTISRIRDKFELYGTICDIQRQKSGRSPTATSVESSDKVLQLMSTTPKMSVRECALQTGVSRSSIHRILKNAKTKQT